jgi:hypothetical protein
MAKTVAGRVTHFHQANFDEEPYRKRKEVQRVLLRKKKNQVQAFDAVFICPVTKHGPFVIVACKYSKIIDRTTMLGLAGA